jgi:hypothetical protein
MKRKAQNCSALSKRHLSLRNWQSWLASRNSICFVPFRMTCWPTLSGVIWSKGWEARKARIAAPGKPAGKSGGLRYLYLYLEARGRIHLLFLFSKRGQADLTNEQRKRVAALVEIIKRGERT